MTEKLIIHRSSLINPNLPLPQSLPNMDRIILAYCRDNADLAEQIDRKLGRVGIPFEHLTNRPGAMPGQFAAWVQSTSDPVILLITDNFLKNQSCMASGLTMLQHLMKADRVLPVVADGKIARTGTGATEAVPTQFERVIHAIQYMNFWQSSYLEMRSKKEDVAEGDMAIFEERLGVVHEISVEIGEFLNKLRESNYVSWAQFSANDFEMFFQRFGIGEWHDQYRQLAALDMELPHWASTESHDFAPETAAPQHAPEPEEEDLASAQLIEIQENTPQPLAATQAATHDFPTEQPAEHSANGMGEFAGMDSLIDEIVREEAEDFAPMLTLPDAADALDDLFAEDPEPSAVNPQTEPEPVANSASEAPDFQEVEAETPALESPEPTLPEPEILPETPVPPPGDDAPAIEQTIRDAQLWHEKGHTERALEMLELAWSEHPQSEALNRAFHAMLEKNAAQNDPAHQAEMRLVAGKGSAADYDLLADVALSKGDFLTARSLWEKAVLLDPTLPGVYLKLGKLTDDHLKGHKKAVAEYFRLAADQTPDNPEIHERLAAIYLEHLDEPKSAIRYLLNVVALQNDHPTAWFDLATAYRAVGEPERAQTCYLRAAQFDPLLRSEANDRQFLMPTKAETATETEAMPAAAPPKPKRDPLTVLITGATSGIGRATAEIFAREGHHLILVGRREERLQELSRSFSENYHADILLLPFDVRDFGAAKNALENLPEAWQNVDVLLNNAGLAKGLDFIHEGNLEHWETMIDTNIKGLLYVTRLVSPGMVRRRRGHIINIGSSAGKEVYPKGNVYCATKFAVDALTRAMRMDLHTHNIRVSQVSPGHVEETEFAVTRFDGDTARAKIYEDFQPLKSSDVAEAIYWLATRPPHVNVQDIVLFGTQQASAMLIDRSGR